MWQSPREWYQKMHDSRGASKNVAPLVYFHQSSFSFFWPAIFEISNPMVIFRQAWFMCTSVHHCRRIGHDNFTLENNLLGLNWLCIKLKTLFLLFLKGNKKGKVKCFMRLPGYFRIYMITICWFSCCFSYIISIWLF